MYQAVLQCEFCDEPIAKCDLMVLERPLRSEMFSDLGPGYSNPFPEGITWEWFRCPMCRNRPFVCTDEQIEQFVLGKWDGPERVKTIRGVYEIGSGYPEWDGQRVVREVHDEKELEKEWRDRLASLGAGRDGGSSDTPEVDFPDDRESPEEDGGSERPVLGPRKAVRRARA